MKHGIMSFHFTFVARLLFLRRISDEPAGGGQLLRLTRGSADSRGRIHAHYVEMKIQQS